jgi:hypothetical protein
MKKGGTEKKKDKIKERMEIKEEERKEYEEGVERRKKRK